jgi:hypothetical protein
MDCCPDSNQDVRISQDSPTTDGESLGEKKHPTLEAYAINDHPQRLVSAPPRREWMDAFANHHPYRCLPLTIANSYGWQLILPAGLSAEWNGGYAKEDLVITGGQHLALSNFACGILTFDVSYVFRTAPGYHLLVTGPTNVFKDGVAPMSAVIETDWLPYSFTFNYKFTRPGRVTWEAGEPYAQICVVQARLQDDIVPVIRDLRENPKLDADHRAWRSKRAGLYTRQRQERATASRGPWDRDYFLGRHADGRPAQVEHTMKLRLSEPLDARASDRRGEAEG